MLNKILKQFNLEEYLANPSKKVVTRDGESVRIICTDYYGEKPIIAKIEECEHSYPFYEDGKFLSYGEPSNLDLFFATEKKEGWINMYKNKDGISWIGPEYFATKEEAEKTGKRYIDYMATIKIEWEE